MQTSNVICACIHPVLLEMDALLIEEQTVIHAQLDCVCVNPTFSCMSWLHCLSAMRHLKESYLYYSKELQLQNLSAMKNFTLCIYAYHSHKSCGQCTPLGLGVHLHVCMAHLDAPDSPVAVLTQYAHHYGFVYNIRYRYHVSSCSRHHFQWSNVTIMFVITACRLYRLQISIIAVIPAFSFCVQINV